MINTVIAIKNLLSIRIKNLIKNLLSLNCQYVPSFTRPYFAVAKHHEKEQKISQKIL